MTKNQDYPRATPTVPPPSTTIASSWRPRRRLNHFIAITIAPSTAYIASMPAKSTCSVVAAHGWAANQCTTSSMYRITKPAANKRYGCALTQKRGISILVTLLQLWTGSTRLTSANVRYVLPVKYQRTTLIRHTPAQCCEHSVRRFPLKVPRPHQTDLAPSGNTRRRP